MIRRALRRPLVTAALLGGVVAASGLGYGAAGRSAGSAAQQTARAVDVHQLAQQADTARTEREFLARAQTGAEAERRAALAEQRAAEAEAARRAAAEAEAARQAEIEAERQAATEEASRAAAARDPRPAARVMLGDFGWGEGQFDCLDVLWERESNWDHTADNPTSSAYGIPQALPGSKMASAGADWQSNPVTQVRWGLGYIAEVYGSPCAALGHSDANGWY